MIFPNKNDNYYKVNLWIYKDSYIVTLTVTIVTDVPIVKP
jgi:hypothetical protein